MKNKVLKTGRATQKKIDGYSLCDNIKTIAKSTIIRGNNKQKPTPIHGIINRAVGAKGLRLRGHMRIHKIGLNVKA